MHNFSFAPIEILLSDIPQRKYALRSKSPDGKSADSDGPVD